MSSTFRILARSKITGTEVFLLICTLVIPLLAQAQTCRPHPDPNGPCGTWICIAPDEPDLQLFPAATTCANTNPPVVQCDPNLLPSCIGYCDGWSTTCNPPDTGSLFPSYYILSVSYLPPGNGSYVEYGRGSKIGTTTSTTDSWKNEFRVDISNRFEWGPFAAGDFTVTFDHTWEGSSTTSNDVLQSIASGNRMYGPGFDEINHDYDQITLLLQTRVDGLVYPDRISWSMNLTDAIPQIVLVGWLKGTITDGFAPVRDTLQRHGITEADYPQILSVDPFAYDPTGTSTPDPTRFVLVDTYPFEYLHDTFNRTTNNNYTSTTTDTSKVTYWVGISATTGILFTKLKISDQFTWSSESKNTNTAATSDTETFFLTMPTVEYTGPTNLYLYVDKIYKTFMTSFVRY